MAERELTKQELEAKKVAELKKQAFLNGKPEAAKAAASQLVQLKLNKEAAKAQKKQKKQDTNKSRNENIYQMLLQRNAAEAAAFYASHLAEKTSAAHCGGGGGGAEAAPAATVGKGKGKGKSKGKE